ncbi:HNH endonuclease signature motif containing protein [Variovorax sp. DXTD-1]|uniref:HNH endonuclease signature motif containing protein n=1 Tax=Variovorax sp. DXTD-1 TaxID=2495592 RepID=UPI001C8E8E18|nr:HNH endonuclease signature motif containing protein [Variovorax sp. DXTD-1]
MTTFQSTNDMTVEQRVAHYSKVDPNTGCVEWQGAKSHGYGVLGCGDKLVLAHRLSYSLRHGPVPADLVVRHRCDNPACVNVEHLEIGTHKDNADDKVERGRSLKGEHCPSAKLIAEQVASIRRDTRTHRAIAAVYGVTHRCIGNIKSRATWAHI